MVQTLRQQGLPPVFTIPTGVTFHGRVLYPPGKWGRRRPVFPATVEVYRSTQLIPLWETAETAIDGTFATKQRLTTGMADVVLKIRDGITTDRFEIDLSPSAAPGASRPRLSAGAVTNAAEPAEIVVPWNPQSLPSVGCLDGRFFFDVHDFARHLSAHLRRRTLPTTVAALWLSAGPNDSKFSRGETVLRGLARTGLPADFPGRLTKKPGAYLYAKSMTEAAIGILDRIVAASTNQIEDSILLRPLLNAAAAALDTYVDWDNRSPSVPFADTAAVCVLHYVAAYMADGGSKTSIIRLGSYKPSFPAAWQFRTVAFTLGR